MSQFKYRISMIRYLRLILNAQIEKILIMLDVNVTQLKHIFFEETSQGQET
jgi:hypothetical protein